MRRKAPLVAFALAVVLPAGALAYIGFRALFAEDMLREAEVRKQAADFARLAAREIRNDLLASIGAERKRLAEALAKGRPPEVVGIFDAQGSLVWPPSEPPSLELAVARERPDLAALVDHAVALEFARQDPAAAAKVYLGLVGEFERPATRAWLVARAARCAAEAGDKAAAIRHFERLLQEHAAGESGLALSATARLGLLELTRDPKFARELLDADLEPAWAAFVLARIEPFVPVGDRLERARMGLKVRAWARTGEDHAWFSDGKGLWAGILARHEDRTAACLVRAAPRIERLQETARVAGLGFAVKCGDVWMSEPLDGEGAAVDGALRVVASPHASEPATSRILWFAGLVAALIASLSFGLFATLRGVNREMRLAQLKSDFVSNVSHELRTPATSVRLFSELLANPAVADESKRREYAALILQEATRLAGLVERVLEFSRLERQAFAFELRDLREIVAQTARRIEASRPGLKFRLELPEAPQPVRADAEALGQAVANLLDNAAKYAGDAEVAVRPVDGRVRVEVRDRGPGIDARDVPHLFEKFYRGRQTLQVPGWGLGLAIVKQIVDAHGGRVDVESRPGQGSLFAIELPLCRES